MFRWSDIHEADRPQLSDQLSRKLSVLNTMYIFYVVHPISSHLLFSLLLYLRYIAIVIGTLGD